MKNKIEDVRNHLFAALERLNDEELTGEALQEELARAGQISAVAQVIVQSAKVEVDFLKAIGKSNKLGSGFIPEEPKQLT